MAKQDDSEIMVVDRDLRCLKCGTDLRGIGLAESCAECSESVERSFEQSLEVSPAGWLCRLVVGLAVYIGAILLYWCLRFVGNGTELGFLSPQVQTWSVYLLYVTGVWLLTLPEPDRRAPHREEILRRWARRVVVVEIVDHLLLGGRIGRVLADLDAGGFIGEVFRYLLPICSFVLLYNYLSELARRVPFGTRIAAALRSIAVAFPLAVILSAFIGVIVSGGALASLGGAQTAWYIDWVVLSPLGIALVWRVAMTVQFGLKISRCASPPAPA